MHIDECCWTARNGIPFNCSRSDLNDRVDSGEWRAYHNCNILCEWFAKDITLNTGQYVLV